MTPSIPRPNHAWLHRLAVLLLFVSFAGVLISCSSESDSDKAEAFESRFPPGMSRFEVEQELLNESLPLEIIQVSQKENGDTIVAYRVNESEWGAPTFYFRFSPDNELIVVWPLPTEL